VLKEEGFNVSVIRPAGSHEKEDFNDVLKREGVGGLREYFKEYIDSINLMSERQRAVFSKLEKSIMENKHFSEERKQKWIQFGLKDPQGTLMSWNNILIQQEIMDEQRQGKQAYYSQLHKPPASSPSEEPEIRETEAVLSFLETSQVIDPVDNMAQEMLVKVKGFMDTETFKKFESDLSSNTPEIIIGRCNDILTSREEALKLEADVNRFIELFDKAGLTSSLNNGESKDIFPVLRQIYEEWKNDERFEQRMKESGNTQAAKKVEQYRIEQRMRSLSHGYELEI
jgi:hypothetical protein